MGVPASYAYATGSCQAILHEVKVVMGSRSRYGGQNGPECMLMPYGPRKSIFNLSRDAIGHNGRHRHHHRSPYVRCGGSWRLTVQVQYITRPGTLRSPRGADLGPGRTISGEIVLSGAGFES